MYGPIVYEAEIDTSKLFEPGTTDYGEAFKQESVFRVVFGRAPKKTKHWEYIDAANRGEDMSSRDLTELDLMFARKESDKERKKYADMRKLYFQAFRNSLEAAGYQGMLWVNSDIDESHKGFKHHVMLIFNSKPMPVK